MSGEIFLASKMRLMMKVVQAQILDMCRTSGQGAGTAEVSVIQSF